MCMNEYSNYINCISIIQITMLIKQLNNDKTGTDKAPDRDLLERLEILQDAFERVQKAKVYI